MKIKEQDYLYFNLMADKEHQEAIIKSHGEQTPQIAGLRRMLMKEMLSTPDWHDYFISDQAYAKIKQIDVSKVDTLFFMKDIPVKKCSFILGKNLFIRAWLQGDEYRILYMDTYKRYGEVNQVYWSLFTTEIRDGRPMGLGFDLDPGSLIYQEHIKMVDALKRLVLYIFFSDTEYRYIAGNSKSGKTLADKVINQTPRGFTMVTANWNTVTIRGKLVEINPFWRMQACGPEWSERKPVLVKAHSRSKTIRAKKETSK